MSIGGVALIIGQAAPMLSAAGSFPLLWNAGVAVLAGMVCLFAVAGRVLPHRLLRAGWILGPTLGAALQLTSFWGYSGPVPPEQLPSILSFDAVLSAYFMLWLRPWAAAVGTLGSGLLVAASGLLFLGTVPDLVAVATPIHMSNVIYIALFVAIRRRMVSVQAARRRAQVNQERKVRARIEATHQEHVARLIHDEVLSVLTAALPARGEPGPPLRAAAGQALDLLRAPPGADDITLERCDRAADRLSAMIAEQDPVCRVHATAGSGTVPTIVSDALVAASCEAVRNSVRHAGPDATRSVHARITPGDVIVSISDDGVGFDPFRIRPDALGVEQSIRGRMRALPGGDASISSAPGATTVVLTWHT